MAYTPTEWQCGDVVTAEKLNKLENGLADCCGGGGAEPLIVHDYSEAPLDKTWQEIYDAINAGKIVHVIREEGDFQVSATLTLISGEGSENDYVVRVVYAAVQRNEETTQVLSYYAETADGYPILD